MKRAGKRLNNKTCLVRLGLESESGKGRKGEGLGRRKGPWGKKLCRGSFEPKFFVLSQGGGGGKDIEALAGNKMKNVR